MSQKIDREGTFEATVFNPRVIESKEGAVGIVLDFDITQCVQSDGPAEDWREYGFVAEGTFWAVKKDGNVNDTAVKALTIAGWNGSIVDAASGKSPLSGTPVQIVVKREEYNGIARFKVAFVNEPGRSGVGGGGIDEAKAKQLQAKFGTKFRALVGGGKPSSPAPARPSSPAPTKAPEPAYPESEIPF